MAKKSILYIITKSVWGGAAKYVYDLATHLPKDKLTIAVALVVRENWLKKLLKLVSPILKLKISNGQ
jgi:hypothetical protein